MKPIQLDLILTDSPKKMQLFKWSYFQYFFFKNVRSMSEIFQRSTLIPEYCDKYNEINVYRSNAQKYIIKKLILIFEIYLVY